MSEENEKKETTPIQETPKEKAEELPAEFNPDKKKSEDIDTYFKNYIPLQNLEFIYSNLKQAQQSKGSFTITDCRNLLNSYRCLKSFLTARAIYENIKEKDPEAAIDEPKTTDEVMNASRLYLAAAEVQQATGVFTIEGSAELFDAFHGIEKKLKICTPPQPIPVEIRGGQRRGDKKHNKQNKKKK
jgi:hypothetical protein